MAVHCVQCLKPVEPARECYASPVCYACLPPPEPLPVIPLPGVVKRLHEAMRHAPTWNRLKQDAITDLITKLDSKPED